VTALQPDEATIFNTARRLGDRDTRADYLRDVCEGDTALLGRVEALLAVNDAPDSLLDRKAMQTPACDDTRTDPSVPAAEPLGFLAPSDRPGALGRFGHYDVTEVIGRGGMGIVLKAFDRKLHRVVAIKVLAQYLAAGATARTRFVREARAAAAIRNDHVIDIHAVEEENGLPYLVMEYVSGVSLQDRLNGPGRPDLAEILRIGVQTARGLAAAHAQGVTHRDVKPANILLEDGGERVKLTDFGLARAADDASLTQPGLIIGTPMYMSPEQARGEPVDPRSDLFSLGSVLYALCTGHPPFRADTSLAVLRRICEDTPPDPRDIDPAVPAWLVAVITRLHAKDPAARYPSATEVADVLGQLPAAGRAPAPRRRFRKVRAALLAVALAGVAVTITLTDPSVYRYATNRGELIVETDDPDVEVTVKKDGETVQILDKKSGRTVELKAGLYRLALTGGANGLTLSTDQFTLERGGQAVVTVRMSEPAITEVRSFTGAPEACHIGRFCLGDQYVLTGGGSLVKDGAWVTGTDFDLRLWDRATGKEVARLPSHKSPVIALAVSPDGKRAVTGGNSDEKTNYAIRVWDLESRKELRRFTKHTGRVMGVAFLPDGKRVVSVGGPKNGLPREGVWGEVRLWDVETAEEIRQFNGHKHEVKWVAVLPDGKRMLTTGQDRVTILWNIETGEELRRMEGNDKSGAGAALAPDGRHAALACWDRSILYFETETLTEVRRLTGYKGWPASMAFAPDGRRLLAGCEEKTVHLWDVATGKQVCEFGGGFQGPAGVLGIAADGKEALVNSWDGSLRLVRLPAAPPADKKK
jgi:WD40 repeat protein